MSVRDINPGAGDFHSNITDVGGTLFFVFDSDALWVSDGTEAGAVLASL